MAHDISLFSGTAWYIVFLFSTTLHEASHAFTSYKLGDDTAHRGGQVTLDPIPHIMREPLGMVVVPLISYFYGGWMIGWASAPYNAAWAHMYPKRAGIKSMAGPASNLLLFLVAFLMIRVGTMAGVFYAPNMESVDHVVAATRDGWPYFASIFLSIAFSLNLLLFLFNLLPFPPLDGSAIPLFFLSPEALGRYWEIVRSPGTMMVGMVVAWKIFDFIFPPAHLFVVNLLFPGVHYG